MLQVERILKRGAWVEGGDDAGRSMLHGAALQGKVIEGFTCAMHSFEIRSGEM